VLSGEDGGGGIEDVEYSPSFENRKCVDAMRELRIIVVASASNQVICGESASEAPAIM
jgi:hypothetical protein